MYFSRVRIENGVLAQTKLLKACQGDLYAVHQLIWKLFPGDPDSKRTFLFRQEFEKEQIPFENTRRGLPLFYMVSQKVPASLDGLLTVDLKEYHPRLNAGDKFCFDLRVNPVIARKTGGKKRSVKHDVLMDAKYRAKMDGINEPDKITDRMHNSVTEWFVDKGKSSGFSLVNPKLLEITSYRQYQLRKGSKSIRFSSVDLAGVLTVFDPVLFEKILFNGIGASKSFGCGLMLVKPI